MALSQRAAVEAAREIFNGPRVAEAGRLDRIAAALNPRTPTVELPTTVAPTMRRLAEKARTNYLPLVVTAFSQVLKVEGYRSANMTDNAGPWAIWQANGFDARQAGVHRSTLAFGASYVTVVPGDPAPRMRGVSARNMTALYDPDDDEWPLLALQVEPVRVGDRDEYLLRLFDEESVYYLGGPEGHLEFIEERRHGLGVTPVVRYRDLMVLEGESQTMGVVEPVLEIQERIDETVFGMLVAQYFAAFRQRYIIGWVPKSEAEALKTSASRVWTFEDSPQDMQVGEMSETDLTRYLASKESGAKDISAISQLPPTTFAVGEVSNISAEALAALQSGRDQRAGEFQTSLGESHEQALRLAALAAGDATGWEDSASQVRWKDLTARSLGQTVDALGKLSQMLEVPQRALWGLIPGVSDTDLEEWDRLAAAQPPPPFESPLP